MLQSCHQSLEALPLLTYIGSILAVIAVIMLTAVNVTAMFRHLLTVSHCLSPVDKVTVPQGALNADALLC